MRLVTHSIEHTSRSDSWFIKPLGDIHLGSINCDEALLDKDIRWILKNEALWAGLGDYMECITSKDRRFRPEDIEQLIAARLTPAATEDAVGSKGNG